MLELEQEQEQVTSRLLEQERTTEQLREQLREQEEQLHTLEELRAENHRHSQENIKVKVRIKPTEIRRCLKGVDAKSQF